MTPNSCILRGHLTAETLIIHSVRKIHQDFSAVTLRLSGQCEPIKSKGTQNHGSQAPWSMEQDLRS